MKHLDFLYNQIIAWYKDNKRDLPWRKKNISAYEVWISEVMLQQTQVSRVIPYFDRFIQKFPTIQELAMSSWEGFLPYYEGLGYYRRGENILKTAKIITQKHNGIFPQDKKMLLDLPGIGEYTANAILSFAYDEDVLAVDTNLKRVFGRFFKGTKTVETRLIASLPIASRRIPPLPIAKKNMRDFNAATMDFANLVCTNKKPECFNCPLQKHCKYPATKGKLEIKPLVETKHASSLPKFETKNAQSYLFLHKNHTIYFSPNHDEYTPFILPPPYNTRHTIKEYFLTQYGLTLSVRPPHKKTYIDNKPTLYINAQILLGDHSFAEFPNNAVSMPNE